MKRILLTMLALLFITGLTASRSFAAAVGIKDTFQNGTTNNWFAGGLGLGQLPPTPPQVVNTGGPAGAGDQFLMITGTGIPNAPGSRIVALNGAQWSGNYTAAGIFALEMDLKNLGQTPLTIRLQFEDPVAGPPVDEAVTTFGAFLPVGSGWTHVAFQLSPASLTSIFGSPAIALSNTTLLRIIDSPTPGEAVTIAGVLGVDNITAVAAPETSSLLLLATSLIALVAICRRPSLQ
jgi:hypothetical protein